MQVMLASALVLALAQRVRDADLIVAIGPRLGEMTTRGVHLAAGTLKHAQKLVHIHASAEELNRVYQADLAIHATMNAAARSLEVLTAPHRAALEQDWTHGGACGLSGQLQAHRHCPAPSTCRPLLLRCKSILPADAVLTNGAGNFASWMHRFYKHHGLVKGHKTQLAPTVGAMGYGVPAGIAANLLTGSTWLSPSLEMVTFS
jgi:acetolactate synthase I/II/III large subunit